MDSQKHWENVYQSKSPDNVSWYQSQPTLSLRWIESAAPSKNAPLIDVGAGASTLADHLLDLGYSDLSLLDISQTALDLTKARLGTKAANVQWLVGDISSIELPKATYKLWHDRAVFHFLTAEEQRRAYHAQLVQSLAPNAHLIMATFASTGPQQCSGLDVVRYDAEGLQSFLGDAFTLLESAQETHKTPWDSAQEFIYCHFQYKP